MHLLYPKNSTWRWLGAISNPRVRKIVLIFLMTVRPLSWACGNGTEMLLILKKKNSVHDIFRYDSPKKCPTILYAVNLWLKPVTATDWPSLQTRDVDSMLDQHWVNVYPCSVIITCSSPMSHHQRSQRSCFIRFLSEHTITLLFFSVYSIIMINVRKTGCSQGCDN